MSIERVTVAGLAKLPAFCHATIAGDFVFVSGTLGTLPDSMRLIDGGTGAQTQQALRNIETILRACGATLADLVKVNVYLADMATYAEMNDAYLRVIGAAVPARITVGRAQLALGAAVEIDAIAYRPRT